ncbi:MAG: uracil-DNA glycosylase, partial [Lentisphaeria bacterium]|nr:uracil-DNA glycosylase [Lentisphaeria bacterium]
GNRVPEPDEAAACIGYLKQQIRIVQPEVIVLLGGTALSFLLREKASISKMRGNWIDFEGIPVMPTFHPAYLLRQESAKREAWNDLQKVMKALGVSRHPGSGTRA